MYSHVILTCKSKEKATWPPGDIVVPRELQLCNMESELLVLRRGPGQTERDRSIQ